MAHPTKSLGNTDESVADILIVTGLIFALLSCLLLVGIF